MKSGKYLIMKDGKVKTFSSSLSHRSQAAGEGVLGAGHFKKMANGKVKLMGMAESLGGIKPKKSDLPKVTKKLK